MLVYLGMASVAVFNMFFLGVCNANDSGAALLVDGQLIASISEERLSRIKGHRVFPQKSIQFCLDFAGISVDEVDYVACGAWGGIAYEYLPSVFGGSC